MNDRKNRPVSDAGWHFRKAPDAKRFMKYFFSCGESAICTAALTEKQFIEEVARVTHVRERAQQLGLPLPEVRPSFAS